MKVIACIYDRVAETYENPMTFDNEMLPYAQCRRLMRDLFLQGEVNLDQMKDRELHVVATFNPEFGTFEKLDDVEIYPFTMMVNDLEEFKDEISN